MGNKFRTTLGLCVGSVMNCADNSGAGSGGRGDRSACAQLRRAGDKPGRDAGTENAQRQQR